MGRIEFDIDTFDHRIADDIQDAIDEGIKDSTGRRTAHGIADIMSAEAKGKIRSEGAVWTGELLNSFQVRYLQRGNRIVVVFQNDADHAPALEYGAEYGSEGPPVHALIPWVMTHLSSWTIPDADAGGLPAPEDIDYEREDVDDELLEVAMRAPDGVIEKAFWLQEKIRRDGIDAIEFMEQARRWAEKDADRVVADAIDRRL